MFPPNCYFPFKLIFVLIAMLLLSNAAFSQKLLKKCECAGKYTEDEIEFFEKEILIYDREGRLLKEEKIPYYISGEYFYDEKGRLIKKFGTSGETSFFDSLVYAEGSYVHFFYSTGTMFEGQKTVFLNEKGNPTQAKGKKISVADENEWAEFEEKWKYDANDSLTEYVITEVSLQDGFPVVFSQRINYEYDRRCGKIARMTYAEDDLVRRQQNTLYDKDCRIIREEDFMQSVFTSSVITEYFYDKKGLLQKKAQAMRLGNEESVETKKFSYDEKDRILTEETQLSIDGSERPAEVVTYAYDASGAFTKTFHDNEKIVIEFYDPEKRLVKQEIREEDGRTSYVRTCQYEFFD